MAASSLALPPWTAICATKPPDRKAVLIDGLLRCGHVALLAAKGKTGKSWSAIELACAVATGGYWFGRKCTRGRVLYIDPEIDPRSLDNRFHAVCEAMHIDSAKVDANVFKWPLRGVESANMSNIIHDLKILEPKIILAIIDSASCFVEGDENSSVDIRRFSAKVLEVSAITGAAVLLVHHYGKGAAGDRETADRARGSSVWLDFPDCTLFLTEVFPPSGEPADYLNDGERAFVLETGGLREFSTPEPTRLLFAFPVHRVDDDGITEDWKPSSSARKGGKAAGEVNRQRSANRASRCELALASEFIAQGIGADGIPATEAATIVSDAIGEAVNAQTLKSYIEASEWFNVEQVSPRRWKVVPKRVLEDQPTIY